MRDVHRAELLDLIHTIWPALTIEQADQAADAVETVVDTALEA